MASTIKGLSAKQLSTFLPKYVGTKMTKFPKIPIFFNVKTEGENMFLMREFLYSDFKESFPHFALLAKSCSKLNYYPDIFNVYNKVIIKCYSEKDGKKFVSTKDLFMAFLLNELEGNQ
jgi:pterin-4a-carbinolamine dehydratase